MTKQDARYRLGEYALRWFKTQRVHFLHADMPEAMAVELADALNVLDEDATWKVQIYAGTDDGMAKSIAVKRELEEGETADA